MTESHTRRCRPPTHHHRAGSATFTVRRDASTRLPTEGGTFQVIGYRGLADGAEHVALIA
ncbi:hypothetical protein GCM10010472_65350 [Pseudonocardia halophobica]|uniref:Uncharacterized protein n=1 Tax=Pseudonocardia halophobica TaxID=29401 RepID=A0A9W6L944_9PSEU|nr:hypothetical protein GCM10017577_51310 [Pseudonocardia halophobica]